MESSFVPTVIAISGYEESRSCSKKKAYQALGDFVKAKAYIWQLVQTPDFTAKVECDLRSLLLSMREEDRSLLYRGACSYYSKFKTDPLDLTNLRKKSVSDKAATRSELQQEPNSDQQQQPKRGPPEVPATRRKGVTFSIVP